MSTSPVSKINPKPQRIQPVKALIGLLLLIWAIALGPGVGSSPAGAVESTLTLNVVYNVDGTIAVTLADGTPVGTPNPPGTEIPPGTYKIVFNNKAKALHMFHLFGAGVKLITDLRPPTPDGMCGTVDAYMQETWQETFLPNSTYVFQDDYQPTVIHAVFRTSGAGAAGETSGSTSSSSSSSGTSSGAAKSQSGSKAKVAPVKPDPFRGTLAGTVTATGKLTLTRNGQGVGNLEPGRYKIAVTDKTSTRGFTVQQKRKPPIIVTGLPFVGRHTVTVDLKAGQWMFYSAEGQKNYFMVIPRDTIFIG